MEAGGDLHPQQLQTQGPHVGKPLGSVSHTAFLSLQFLRDKRGICVVIAALLRYSSDTSQFIHLRVHFSGF